jgi:hypothetical protein
MAESKVPKAVTGTPVDVMSDEDIIEMYKNFALSKPIYIPKDQLDPNFEYRWINRHNPAVFQRRRGVGWQPVTKDDLAKLCRPGVTVEDLRLGTGYTPDGLVSIGDDLVFAKIPRRYAEAIRAHHTRINKERVKAGRNKFHAAGELTGATTFERT